MSLSDVVVEQLFDIRAEDVFQLAMSKLRASTRVNKTIGSGKPASATFFVKTMPFFDK